MLTFACGVVTGAVLMAAFPKAYAWVMTKYSKAKTVVDAELK